jgi:acyl-CoA synthetase (NDP forming)
MQAERIGFPVVLKASGLAHKTEAGGVALNLSERDSVQRCTDDGRDYLVEEMVGGGVVEILVGILRDPAMASC